jgi:HlyD family secretion protein
VIATLLFLSWLIRYPDIVPARVSLTTDPPPARIVAQASGKLTGIFVENDSVVTAGAYLAAIENPANTEDVLSLEKALKKAAPYFTGNAAGMPELEWDRKAVLGQLQPDYAAFIQSMDEYGFFNRSDDYRSDKIRALKSQIRELEGLNANLQNQITILKQDAEIARNQLSTVKELFNAGAATRKELQDAEVQALGKELALERAQTSIFNNNIQVREFQKTILDLEQGETESMQTLRLRMEETYKQLSGSLENWKQQYLIVSPVSGRTVFFDFWAENQYIRAGDEVMTIIPDYRMILGKATLSGARSGKVMTGMRANIKLDDFDYREFGMLEARVTAISAIPRDNVYVVDLALENGMRSTYGKDIPFHGEMPGNAELITEDLRLIERILFRIRSLLDASD